MSDSQLPPCPRCGSVGQIDDSFDPPAPPMNLPQRLRDWMSVPMDNRPEPREWR